MKPDYIRKKIEAKRKKNPCGLCDKVFDDVGALLAHEDTHGEDGTSESSPSTDTPKRNIPYRS